MTERLFGTDGIRGRVNGGAIRPDMFLRFGEALGKVLRKSDARPRVLLGRDTRRSGEMIEAAIQAGLLNAGVDTVLGGVMPTPAVGYITRETGFSAGLMITASHNPYPDNGVKVFGPDGFKLPSDAQEEIEALIQDRETTCFVDVANMGVSKRDGLFSAAYVDFACNTMPQNLRLNGLRIVVDAANGAGFEAAEKVFSTLGAQVFTIGGEPTGSNINEACGAMHPEGLQKAVREHKADIGIALDGDADRIILADATGKVIDGDQIMGAIGLDYHKRDILTGNAVVATIMSNLGLETALRKNGIKLERTAVGDRYVVERMREGGFCVGGEQSGHIVLTNYVTTGDAIIAAVQVMSIMVREQKSAAEVLSVFQPVPQILKNVRYQTSAPLDHPQIVALISDVERDLGDEGRLVIRKSGTEPVIRVMVEAYDRAVADSNVDLLLGAIAEVDKTG